MTEHAKTGPDSVALTLAIGGLAMVGVKPSGDCKGPTSAA